MLSRETSPERLLDWRNAIRDSSDVIMDKFGSTCVHFPLHMVHLSKRWQHFKWRCFIEILLNTFQVETSVCSYSSWERERERESQEERQRGSEVKEND